MKKNLQGILQDLSFDALPPAWAGLNLADFSPGKRLWDYQQAALRYALLALHRYYDDLADYAPGEAPAVDAGRKAALWQWYRDNGIKDNLDLPLGRKQDVRDLLAEFYESGDGGKIPYANFINRLGFWMATGSGKTVVIVKLLELLWQLIRRNEIPAHDILVLAHRDDLLAQLRLHVEEFNRGGGLHIRLRELRDYPDVKRGGPSLFQDSELTVFYYRSDNLSDEQKEKIINFRNYDNFGRWYILLDEAHKGDKEDSKRQHIYSVMARRGFVFNFSATFTDARDIVTTAYDFNLAKFIDAGYGKNIGILTQQNRAFGDDEDYTGLEKQRIVLQTLLLLTYVQRVGNRPQLAGLYHQPLLLALVNSVNTKDSDLKLFFRQLERIGRGDVPAALWAEAKSELWRELAGPLTLMFGGGEFTPDRALFEALTLADVLEAVYHAGGPGEMEVLLRPANRQEMALKLKSAERPFALIKIGDISGWFKAELDGYHVIDTLADDSYFEQLNRDDSGINILMGSRSFYEGWDSNRPNVITFINIGVGADARKFILQAVGRGVRVQPAPGLRQRWQQLYNAKAIDEDLYRQVKDHATPLETVFIFGTNRDALQKGIEELDQAGGAGEPEHTLTVPVNPAAQGRLLLIPVNKEAQKPLAEQQDPKKFEVADSELETLRQYVDHFGSDRLLLARHNATPRQIALLRRALAEPERYFYTANGRLYGGVDILLPRLLSYFSLIPKEFEQFKPVADEIDHYRRITVQLQDLARLTELQAKLDKVAGYKDPAAVEAELDGQLDKGEITKEQWKAGIKAAAKETPVEKFYHAGVELEIRHVANHYYLPLIMSDNEKVNYIKHIIRYESERAFIRALENHLEQGSDAFKGCDWWMFSKLDETLDQVCIPWYDGGVNRLREFYPDFIFWLKRGSEYDILFVDPKGMIATEYQHKLDGYRQLFEDAANTPRPLHYEGLTVRVHCYLYTAKNEPPSKGYERHWVDSPAAAVRRALGASD
jgi:hypothetical protein